MHPAPAHRVLALASWAFLAAAVALAPPARAHSPLDQTIDQLTALIARSPADPMLYLRRGEMHRLERRWERARADYAAAARLAPDLEAIALCRAALLLDTGEPGEALAALDRLPAHGAGGAAGSQGGESAAEARLLRARALRALGRARDAAAEIGVAIALLPNPKPDLFVEQARLLADSGVDGARDEALRVLEAGIARLGPLVSLEEPAIDLECAAGRPEAALARLDRIGPQLERKDAWLARRSTLLAAAGRASADARSAAAPAPVPRAAVGFEHALFEPAAPPSIVSSPVAPVAAARALALVTRGPYLQLGTPTSVVVRWRTDTASDSRVAYGTAVGYLDTFVDDATLTTEHVVPVAGLSPDTKYFYSVGTTAGPLAGDDDTTFVLTPPLAGTAKPTRAWVIGDAGTATAAQAAVRDAYVGYTGSRHTDLWLMLGDNAYSTGTDAEYQNGVFNVYPAMLRKSVVWPTRGNHDAIHAGGNNDYYDIFTMPTAAQAGGVASGTEAYYSYDYGNVHFVCLDSEGSDRTPGGPMMTWLRSDVSATTRDWVVAYWHHPPYTKGSHDSDNAGDSGGRMRDMRQNALPILDSLGVDLVLTGHSHSYERSLLLDGHYGLSGTLVPAMVVDGGDGREGGDGAYGKLTLGRGPHEGTVYAVAGSSGQISGGTLDHPAMFVSLNVLGSMVLDFDGSRLDARFLNSTGAVEDSFTVIKGPPVGVGHTGPGGVALLLEAPRPNPFAAATRVSFTLPRAGYARLSIHDVSGRLVADLLARSMDGGPHSVVWDGRDGRGARVPPGVYFARLEAADASRTRKIHLVR
jgi:tetratricopeptide (TPR) repeat protein